LAELWPFNKRGGFFCVLPDTKNIVQTTSQKLLVQFHSKFTGMISTCTQSIVVHINGFIWFNEFCWSYDPLIIFVPSLWARVGVGEGFRFTLVPPFSFVSHLAQKKFDQLYRNVDQHV
jgi:hypothetical protein